MSQYRPEMPNTFRLDLRILVKAKDGNDLEAAAGEFASKIATMASKLFKDKLKSILVAKHHFNELVCAARYVDTKVLKTIRIPILQIMGTSCFLYSFGLVDKTVYTVQDVDDCVYPATMMQVKKRCHRRPSPAVCQDYNAKGTEIIPSRLFLGHLQPDGQYQVEEGPCASAGH